MRFVKIVAIVAVLLCLMAGAAYFLLPKVMVKMITSEKAGLIIPKGVKQEINQKMDDVPAVLDSLEKDGVKITIDDIIKIIDKTSVDEVERTINALQEVELKNKDHAAEIILENMDLGILENEKVVALVKKKVTMAQIKKMLKMARENGKPYALTIPMGKETVKGLLRDKKKEVEEALNE